MSIRKNHYEEDKKVVHRQYNQLDTDNREDIVYYRRKGYPVGEMALSVTFRKSLLVVPRFLFSRPSSDSKRREEGSKGGYSDDEANDPHNADNSRQYSGTPHPFQSDAVSIFRIAKSKMEHIE